MRTLPRLLLVLVLLLAAAPAAAAPPRWTWPLSDASVERGFEPPATEYGAGNRGVDLRGRAGEPVRAVAAGRVTFAGQVAGVPVVVVDHGAERSTYQPVAASVRVGDAVHAGEPLGTLRARHSHCAPAACLHLGRLAGDEYRDPLAAMGAGRFRLVDPDGPLPHPPAGEWSGDLGRPVAGPVTSPFGMRVHPVTGVRKLHDGTDIAAPCGTPVRAAAAGTVSAASFAGAYGNRVDLDHGDAVTGYAHLSAMDVAPGQRVAAGDVVGRVGSTGSSTGCHLHLMLLVGGRPTDPLG
jgi:murein DD-endopeptidase MepM/ murein hydrolase activator NlpD